MLDNGDKEHIIAVEEIAGLYNIYIGTQNSVLQLCCERLLTRESVHLGSFIRARASVTR